MSAISGFATTRATAGLLRRGGVPQGGGCRVWLAEGLVRETASEVRAGSWLRVCPVEICGRRRVRGECGWGSLAGGVRRGWSGLSLVMSPQVRRTLEDDDPTVVTWRQMLIEVGGLSEDEFAAFVSRWRAFVAEDERGWFDHETEGYYAAPLLIPAELRDLERLGGRLVRLENEIHYILDRYFHPRRTFDRSLIPEIRHVINKAVAAWKAANRPVT